MQLMASFEHRDDSKDVFIPSCNGDPTASSAWVGRGG